MTKHALGLVIATVVGCSSGETTAPQQVDAGSAAIQSSGKIVAAFARFDAFRGQLGRGAKVLAASDGFRAPSTSASFAARVGKTAREPVRLSHPSDDTLWIELRAEDVREVAGVVDEGSIVFADAALDTDIVDVIEPARFEDLRLLRSPHASPRARYTIRTGPGIASVRVREGHVEALDAKGYVHFATASLFAVDAKGTQRNADVRIDGELVEVSLATAGLEYPIALDPAWSATANLTYRHTDPKVTRLSTGKVLAVGGGGTGISFSELYDPVANTWSSAAIGESFGDNHWIVLLAGDKVLVGGAVSGLSTYLWEATGPAGGTWTKKADASTRRAWPVTGAVSGGALVAGGYDGSYLSTVEFYDPAANTWTAKASMPTGRWNAGGGVVGGKLVVAGGSNATGPLSTVEEYTFSTNTWTAKASLPAERYSAGSIVLADGRLMLIGGSLDSGTRFASAAIYSLTGSWSIIPMAYQYNHPAAAQMASGRVIVVGVSEAAPSYNETQVFDPLTNTFWPSAPILVQRDLVGVAAVGTASDKAIAVGGAVSAASNTAEIFTDAALGVACSSTSPCSVGVCVDGYCCDSTCTDQCKACDVPTKLGRCSNVDAQPPHGARMSCLPYVNCSAGACATTCTLDTQCTTGFYCNGVNCVRQKARGSDCTATSQCSATLSCTNGYCCDSPSCGTGASCGNAGNLGVCTKNLGTACSLSDTVPCASGNCVDSVCCNTACSGPCVACTAAKKGTGTSGTCGAINDGTDPDNECPAAACAGTVVSNKHVCDGAGACRANGTATCTTGYLCTGGACASSCTDDTSCTSTHYCAGGSCVSKKANGASCTATRECTSAFCADGVCCNEACGGCKACTAALKGTGADGVCGNAAADSDPHNSCAADSEYPKSCKADGMCNGAGGCREYAKASTACDVTTCAGGSIVGKICNGAGLCETSSGASCAPYACAGVACATSCTSDTECAGTAFCSGAGTCVTKKAAGAACSATKECTTGFCTDGVCCDTACEAQCQACDVSGNVGKCSAVSGKPHGTTRAVCAGEGTPCAGTCDGTTVIACSYPGSTTACGASCDAGTETKKVCDAKGACVDGSSSKCLPYACADTTKCGTTCTGDTQCAAGFKCAGGLCAPPASNTCSNDLASTVDASGAATSCGAYRCEKEVGTCRKICTASEECAAGFVCNASTKACDPAAAPVEDDGGCSMHHGRTTGTTTSVLASAIALGLLARRRRSAARR